MSENKTLISFLKKKGINNIEYNDGTIQILYKNSDFKIFLKYYPNVVHYYVNLPKIIMDYKKGESIKKLKTKLNRKDFNSAVYKNILKIQEWIKPELFKQRNKKKNLEKLTTELQIYYTDKYGDINIDYYEYIHQIQISFRKKEKNITHIIVHTRDNNTYYLSTIINNYNKIIHEKNIK